MSLLLSFQPGDKVSIGQHRFDVDVLGRRLVDEGQHQIPLGDRDAMVATDVWVCVASVPVGGGLTLAFTAPADVLIVRQREGVSQ